MDNNAKANDDDVDNRQIVIAQGILTSQNEKMRISQILTRSENHYVFTAKQQAVSTPGLST